MDLHQLFILYRCRINTQRADATLTKPLHMSWSCLAGLCFAHADPLAARLDRQLAHRADFLAAGKRWTFYSAPSTQHMLLSFSLLHIYSNIKSQHKECTGCMLYTKEVLSLEPVGSQGPKTLRRAAEALNDLLH